MKTSKPIFTKRNLFYFVQFCILFFGVSFPFYQTIEIFDIYHPLWILIPGGLFIIIFSLSFGTVFDLNERALRFFKKIAAYWLGGGFILFWVIIVLSIINIFIDLPQMWMFGTGLAISSLLIIYAYHHGSHIFINRISFTSNKISKKYQFIQLSDIHIGSNGKHEVERIITYMEDLDYDFVVITGDLVDEDYASYDALETLNNIAQPMYYITGNHEYYLRHKSFTDFIQKTNINDLNNKKTSFEELDIYGIDEKSDVGEVLDILEVDLKRYAIGLMHEPKTNQMKKSTERSIDLMLSGHTHSGQIFPLTLMVKARYSFLRGLYTLGNMDIHVSQGTGTWGPKMRLGTRNEITVITLIPEKDSQ